MTSRISPWLPAAMAATGRHALMNRMDSKVRPSSELVKSVIPMASPSEIVSPSAMPPLGPATQISSPWERTRAYV